MMTKMRSMLDGFEIRMPTPEEHRQTSLGWLNRIQNTLIDQWPADLMALSMPTKLVPFPEDLQQEFWGLYDGKAPGPTMNAKALELDAIMGWDRKFVRLNSRSPKDGAWPFAVPVTISGKEALSILAGSNRVIEDLVQFKYVPEQPVYICLRDFVPGMTPDREFRCFVKDGELIAVTHYDYQNAMKAPEDGGAALRGLIDNYFNNKLKPVLHMDTVVFDLYIGSGEPMVIEINPYGLSDPCFFLSYEHVENARSYIQYEFAEPVKTNRISI